MKEMKERELRIMKMWLVIHLLPYYLFGGLCGLITGPPYDVLQHCVEDDKDQGTIEVEEVQDAMDCDTMQEVCFISITY